MGPVAPQPQQNTRTVTFFTCEQASAVPTTTRLCRRRPSPSRITRPPGSTSVPPPLIRPRAGREKLIQSWIVKTGTNNRATSSRPGVINRCDGYGNESCRWRGRNGVRTCRIGPLPASCPTPRAGWRLRPSFRASRCHRKSPRCSPVSSTCSTTSPRTRSSPSSPPIGLLDDPTAGGRNCDRDARRSARIGRVERSSPQHRLATGSAPCTVSLEAAQANGGHLSPVSWRQMRRIAEVDANIAPVLAADRLRGPSRAQPLPTQWRPSRAILEAQSAGIEERTELLQDRFPGVERVLEATVAGSRRRN